MKKLFIFYSILIFASSSLDLSAKSNLSVSTAPVGQQLKNIPLPSTLAVKSESSASSKADLIITEVQAPGAIVTGQQFAIRYHVKNIGNGTAPSSMVKYYIDNVIYTTESNLRDNAVRLQDYDGVGSLGSGGDSEENLYYTWSDYNIGTWYFYIVADGGLEVNESNENNNIHRITLNVTKSPVDLQLKNIYLPSTIAAGGEASTRTSIEVYNNSSVAVNEDVFIRYYLSRDNTLQTGGQNPDVYLGYDKSGPFSAYGEDDENFYFTMPVGSSGTYYLFYYLDYFNEVAESDENNIYYKKFSIAKSDLTVTSASISPTQINYNGNSAVNVTFSCTVKNIGNLGAGTGKVKLYANNGYIGEINHNALGAGSQTSISKTISLNHENVKDASNTIKFTVNPQDELNTSNNSRTTSLNVVKNYDFTIASHGFENPSNFYYSKYYSKKVKVKNNGTKDATSVYIGIYVSEDNSLDFLDDWIIGSAYVTLGGKDELEEQIDIYYSGNGNTDNVSRKIIIYIDPDDQYDDELNNTPADNSVVISANFSKEPEPEEKSTFVQDEATSSNFIYPNPAGNEISLNSNKEYSSIEIINSVGSVKIKTSSTDLLNNKIDITNLPSGVYIINLRSDNDIDSELFIKK